MRIPILFITSLLLILALAWKVMEHSTPAGFVVAQKIQAKGHPIYQTSFASSAITTEVHSADMVELPSGDIRAVWYGGTREGHADVAIYTNIWSAAKEKWGQEQIAIDLATTRAGNQRYSRKLGNPVITRGSDQNLWLFYVSAVGGWATSSINLAISKDDGQTWETPKRLITSPALNFSTLVKGKPVRFADGTIGLPVYHEFLAKYGELLRLDAHGNVIDKTRLAWGRDSLQPVIMPYSEQKAVSMLRYAGSPPNRILAQHTNNSGLNWPEPAKTNLPNPNAAISGISVNGGKLQLLVFNDHPEERDRLSLAVSATQGKKWSIIHVFDEWEQNNKNENKKQGYSYPSLIQTNSGDFHLAYTWNVQKIKHIHFNQAWLESKLP